MIQVVAIVVQWVRHRRGLMNYYQAYGLIIKSELVLDELITVEEQAFDIELLINKIPDHIEQEVGENRTRGFDTSEIWFKVANIGLFYIKEGRQIIIKPELEASLVRVNQFIYGRCFAFALLQRNIVALHGATVNLSGEAVMIVGHSGAGKSTLTSALRQDGHGFICDDVSPIDHQFMGRLCVTPAFPVQRVHQSIMEQQNYDLTEHDYIDYGDDKRIYLVSTRDQFAKNPIPLKVIVEIQPAEGTEVSLEELKGQEKIHTVYRNIFGSSARAKIGLNAEYFKKCTEIAKQIPIYRMTRPINQYTVPKQKELLYQVLVKKAG